MPYSEANKQVLEANKQALIKHLEQLRENRKILGIAQSKSKFDETMDKMLVTTLKNMSTQAWAKANEALKHASVNMDTYTDWSAGTIKTLATILLIVYALNADFNLIFKIGNKPTHWTSDHIDRLDFTPTLKYAIKMDNGELSPAVLVHQLDSKDEKVKSKQPSYALYQSVEELMGVWLEEKCPNFAFDDTTKKWINIATAAPVDQAAFQNALDDPVNGIQAFIDDHLGGTGVNLSKEEEPDEDPLPPAFSR